MKFMCGKIQDGEILVVFFSSFIPRQKRMKAHTEGKLKSNLALTGGQASGINNILYGSFKQRKKTQSSQQNDFIACMQYSDKIIYIIADGGVNFPTRKSDIKSRFIIEVLAESLIFDGKENVYHRQTNAACQRRLISSKTASQC